MHMRAAIICSVLTALACTAGMLVAGPLNPPAGAVQGTYKTLSEVEPRTALGPTTTPGDSVCVYRITQPGSYYLTGNVTGVSGKHGIIIAASNVTLDLGGFTVQGVAGSQSGIATTVAGFSRITIRNGKVRGWQESGIDLVQGTAEHCRFSAIESSDNGNAGIRVPNRSWAEDCNTNNNAGYGMDVYDLCTVMRCSAIDNGSNGIDISESGLVQDCVASGNTGSGIRGMNRVRIIDCRSDNNTMAGVRATYACLVRGNSCSGNGGPDPVWSAGILLLNNDNRVEDNHCTGNTAGLRVNGANNVIARNTCAGNQTNWIIPANNAFGAIVNRLNANGAGVNGNTAASTMGTTDPWANFTH